MALLGEQCKTDGGFPATDMAMKTIEGSPTSVKKRKKKEKRNEWIKITKQMIKSHVVKVIIV